MGHVYRTIKLGDAGNVQPSLKFSNPGYKNSIKEILANSYIKEKIHSKCIHTYMEVDCEAMMTSVAPLV